MSQDKTKAGRNKITDIIVNLLARAMIAVARLVPYRFRIPLGGWVISRLVSPLAGYSHRVRENLA